MIHSIDVNYEREIELEDDYFVLKAELSIDFEYLAGADMGFVKAEMLMGRKWVPAPKHMVQWAIEWLRGDGHDEAVQKAEDDRQPDPDRAYDERLDDECHYSWSDEKLAA